jgi:hypothetical protein
MNEDREEIIERLARLEVKVDMLLDEQKIHKDHHFKVGLELLVAVVGSIASLTYSLFK